MPLLVTAPAKRNTPRLMPVQGMHNMTLIAPYWCLLP